jgi:two-component system chemotaxis response regulator CheY
MSSVGLLDRVYLVVDDEAFSRSIVVRMLRSVSSNDIFQAKNGEEALEMVISHPNIECIISDFRMPKINGLQFLRAVRTGTEGVRHDLPFAMLTGYTDKDLVGLALALDVNAFLGKPVAVAVLTGRLERVFSEAKNIQTPDFYEKIILPAEVLPEPEEVRKVPAVVLKGPSAIKSSLTPQATARPAQPVNAKTELPRGVHKKLDEVPENSLLTRDIVSENGALLLAAGTTLSRRLLVRLQDLKDIEKDLNKVWVEPPK